MCNAEKYVLQTLFAKCHEWHVPMVLGVGDVEFAFDTMQDSFIQQGMQLRGVSLGLQVAFLREYHQMLPSTSIFTCDLRA